MTVERVDINCDMGEAFGVWSIGEGVDGLLMPLVSSINVAAGFHAGDPTTIARTVAVAKEHGIGIGVHPGFHDLVGFGRRHIDAAPAELVHDVLYQLGAVRELVRHAEVALQHLKLHGALYMHAARDEQFASALIEALLTVEPTLPVLVMGGSVIAELAGQRGLPTINEFYADRHYGDDGQIVFTRDVGVLDAEAVAAKVLQACRRGTVDTVDGSTVPIEFESICIHSDTPGVVELMRRIRAELDTADIAVRSFAHSD